MPEWLFNPSCGIDHKRSVRLGKEILSAERIRLNFMQRMPFNFLRSFQRCLLVVATIGLLTAHGVGQDWRSQEGWLYAWQNQPSGEFAPDYRRVDPLKPMLSDADIEAYEASKPPSFLDEFRSNVQASAIEITDSPLIPDDPLTVTTIDYNALPETFDAPDFVEPIASCTQMEDLLPETRFHTPRGVFSELASRDPNCFTWQVLPKGLMYRSYIAGEKEPRIQMVQSNDTRSKERVWDAVLGGRVGLLRVGTCDGFKPEGFQLDLEGAVCARVLPDQPSSMLEGSDYRVGMLGTNRCAGTAIKYGYYHVSSHIGDEYLLANPTFNRINYVRDSLIVGMTQDVGYSTQVYGEFAYALGVQGGAKPLEFQFGAQYLPVAASSFRGAPYLASNLHFREEFGGRCGVNTAAGWGWQSLETGSRLRVGFQYYNGPSLQYQFFDRLENLFGFGVWYDY